MELHDAQKRKREAPTSTSSYIFKPLLEDIAISPEESTSEAYITCIELWGWYFLKFHTIVVLNYGSLLSYELTEGNLYVGTSAAEILHYVAIPPDSNDTSSGPSYIFASRLQPTFNRTAHNTPPSGIQQILVLPKQSKACVLCNGTLTFYSLPELSPAFHNTVLPGCSWIGGANLNVPDQQVEEGEIVMICIKSRIRLVRIGDEPRKIRDIEYPGCLAIARRDNFACVADAHAYALLDVDDQQKIPLFPISSLDENTAGGQIEDISLRQETSRPSSGTGDSRGHGRSTSLGTFVSGLGRRSPQSRSQERSGRNTPEPGLRAASPLRPPNRPRSGSATGDAMRRLSVSDKPLPPPPERLPSQQNLPTPAGLTSAKLIPHICSPTANDFLLTTGTSPDEPGVGIFVNLDGDVVRGTVQFDRYPTSVIVDGSDHDSTLSAIDSQQSRDGYILATLHQRGEDGDREVIEIRRWDVDSEFQTEYLDVPFPLLENGSKEVQTVTGHAKLRTILSQYSEPFSDVEEKLRVGRLRLDPDRSAHGAIDESEKRRNVEEQAFSRRLGVQSSQNVLWSGSSIWWLVKNPLILRLDAALEAAISRKSEENHLEIDRDAILRIITSIQDFEANTETEFLTLKYIRQKASLVLFADVLGGKLPHSTTGIDPRNTEDLLVENGLDPRVLLSIIPLLSQELIEGTRGIWIHAGLMWIVELYSRDFSDQLAAEKSQELFRHDDRVNMVRRYLVAWRQRKGFGSIADEIEVFQSVDAALLHLLLYQQDNQRSQKVGISSAARAELYSLVDNGVDCFERAVALLEQYRRLYVLSRLYQNRKMASKVLGTWRRIIEGAEDVGNELRDGENEVRKYLAKIRDVSLIREYGSWLARRNSQLGVQVFADDNSRVQFLPEDVVQMLKEQAPDAVKVYLEHLVFGKKKTQYADRLLAYYLDSVLQVLNTSKEARSILGQSYESYRALQPPKPTYRQFIIDNAVPVAWWQDRLRLLELLGGSHGSEFSYDLGIMLSRIEPFEQDLVPESIILDGRQGRHQQALRLLTHGLGDYHTAINYCLMGGASIFHPISGSLTPHASSAKEDQATLFGYLLTEFLQIEDVSNRLERTGELLERFGPWYDVTQVLKMIPDSWSVELISGFLVGAFRRLVHDKHEAMMVKALSGAENLQVAAALVEKCRVAGARVDELR